MVMSFRPLACVTFVKRAAWPALALILLLTSPASGDIVFTGSSMVFTGSSTTGLSARATFTVDPTDNDVLRLLLENTSPPTLGPSDLLTSMYFNVLTGTTTGSSAPLAYLSATGNVYRGVKNGPDEAVVYAPPPPRGGTVTLTGTSALPSNLIALAAGDNTWQFKTGLTLATSLPPLAFGVGTVGNNSLGSNGFNGNIVGGADFGIVSADVTTQNLDGKLVVRDSILFQFTGFKKASLSQVSPNVVFGFGTNPECIVVVPEPASGTLAALGLLAALVVRGGPRSLFAACVVAIATLALLFALPQEGGTPAGQDGRRAEVSSAPPAARSAERLRQPTGNDPDSYGAGTNVTSAASRARWAPQPA